MNRKRLKITFSLALPTQCWMPQGCQSSNFSQGVNRILPWRWGWNHPLFFYDHVVILFHFFRFLDLQVQSCYLTILFHVQNSTLRSDSGYFQVKHCQKCLLVSQKKWLYEIGMLKHRKDVIVLKSQERNNSSKTV